MKKQQLILHRTNSGNYRAIIKTRHARLAYFEISRNHNTASVVQCFYVNRVRGVEYYSYPKKLVTLKFKYAEILDVIASELDKKYFGVEITDKFTALNTAEFIDTQLRAMQRKYNFLIFIGEGELVKGVPSVIKTRFKNRIHRGIYLEMRYSGNGKGVIADCHYYDRKYKTRSGVIPETLSTVFFNYNRQAILDICNNELNTAFTHIIFVTDGSLNTDNKAAICGHL